MHSHQLITRRLLTRTGVAVEWWEVFFFFLFVFVLAGTGACNLNRELLLPLFPSSPHEQHEPGATFFCKLTNNLDRSNVCTLNEFTQKVMSSCGSLSLCVEWAYRLGDPALIPRVENRSGCTTARES